MKLQLTLHLFYSYICACSLRPFVSGALGYSLNTKEVSTAGYDRSEAGLP